MENLNVVIDGVKYIPEDEKLIKVHNLEYTGIDAWLLNIHAYLLDRMIREFAANPGKALKDIPSAVKWSKKVNEFKYLCEEYLGFKYDYDGFNDDADGESVPPRLQEL